MRTSSRFVCGTQSVGCESYAFSGRVCGQTRSGQGPRLSSMTIRLHGLDVRVYFCAVPIDEACPGSGEAEETGATLCGEEWNVDQVKPAPRKLSSWDGKGVKSPSSFGPWCRGDEDPIIFNGTVVRAYPGPRQLLGSTSEAEGVGLLRHQAETAKIRPATSYQDACRRMEWFRRPISDKGPRKTRCFVRVMLASVGVCSSLARTSLETQGETANDEQANRSQRRQSESSHPMVSPAPCAEIEGGGAYPSDIQRASL